MFLHEYYIHLEDERFIELSNLTHINTKYDYKALQNDTSNKLLELRRKADVVSSALSPKLRTKRMFFKVFPILAVVSQILDECNEENIRDMQKYIKDTFSPVYKCKFAEHKPYIDEIAHKLIQQELILEDKIILRLERSIERFREYGVNVVTLGEKQIDVADKAIEFLQSIS